MSQTFQDKTGREWTPQLDFIRLREIKKLGSDLGDVANSGRVWADILYDDDKALRVLWATLDPGDVTEDEFLAAMDGETLEAARQALREVWVSFTPPPKRGMLNQGMEAVNKAYLEIMNQATERIREGTEEAIANALALGMPQPSAQES